MKFLLLNQAFWPDVASTGQHLVDLALGLAERGHEVTVITSRRAYDHPETKFPRRETWRGIKICRVGSTGFGKTARWRRAADFASFIFNCGCRLLTLPRPDAVVALTSPPLISFVGAVYARWRGAKFFYWVMDLNPDEAVAAGWLRQDSLIASVLHWMSRYSLRRAEKIIALDRFMQTQIQAKGIARERIAVIPPWSHDDAVKFNGDGRERFRKKHGLEDKFVVMYSGNHSPCHPLDTLLQAALRLATDPRFFFLFVGGGSEFRKIQKLAGPRKTEDASPSSQLSEFQPSAFQNAPQSFPNLLCLPYQPLNELSGSLSAADLHVVAMGDPFVGVIHPCKIYNVLSVTAPVLYLGPPSSHLSEVLDALDSAVSARVAHGDVDRCVSEIQRIAALNRRGESGRYAAVAAKFSQAALLPRLLAELECAEVKTPC